MTDNPTLRQLFAAERDGAYARSASISARCALSDLRKAVRLFRAMWLFRKVYASEPCGYAGLRRHVAEIRRRRAELCRAIEKARRLRREAPAGGRLRDAWLAGYRCLPLSVVLGDGEGSQ